MNRRAFVSGMLATPFVAMFANLLPTEKRGIRVSQSVYGKVIPVVLGNKIYYADAGPTLAECKKKFFRG